MKANSRMNWCMTRVGEDSSPPSLLGATRTTTTAMEFTSNTTRTMGTWCMVWQSWVRPNLNTCQSTKSRSCTWSVTSRILVKTTTTFQSQETRTGSTDTPGEVDSKSTSTIDTSRAAPRQSSATTLWLYLVLRFKIANSTTGDVS